MVFHSSSIFHKFLWISSQFFKIGFIDIKSNDKISDRLSEQINEPKVQKITAEINLNQNVDPFSSEKEQHLSAEWSSLVNKAYKILLSPIQRAEYLLRSYNIQIPEGNTATNTEFLMDMMERNEEVNRILIRFFFLL